MVSRRQNIILLALGSCLLFTRFSIISFWIFILVLSVIQPIFRRTKLQNIVWSYTLITILIAIIYMAAWVVGLKISPDWILFILAIASWLVVGFNLKAQKTTKVKGPSDRQTLLVPFLVVLFVCLPLVRSFSSATVLRYSAHTGDDINHLALVEANRKVGGYLYISDASKYASIIQPSSTSYPQGWHINGAFMETLIVKLVGQDSTATRLSSYFIYKTMWLFICVYFVCDLSYVALGFVLKKVSNIVSALLFVSSLFLSLILLVPLFGYGFQSFIAETAFLCAAVIVALQYVKATQHKVKNRYLIVIGLFVVGATYAWILSGLTIVTIILLLLLKEMVADHKYLARWPWWLWPAMIGLGGFTFAQMYIMIAYGISGGGSFITSTGLAPPISTIGVLGLLILTIILVYLMVKKHRKLLISILITVAAEFLLGAFIQQIKFGSQRYYVIKLAYSTALILLAILLPLLIQRLRTAQIPKPMALFVFLGFLILVPTVLRLDFRKSAYPLKDSATIKATTAEYVLGLYGQRDDVIVRAANNEESFLATKLWSSVWVYNSPYRQKMLENMNGQIPH